MDFLTHLFLPLTAVYVVFPEWFDHPITFAVFGFGLFSDFDKLLGMPGFLHSLVTIVPICLFVLVLERWIRGEWRYAPVVSAVIGSHLVLDFIDGGPVPLLYPFLESGIGLAYPARTVFGSGFFGVRIEGRLVALRITAPEPGFNTYGFIQGTGVAWLLVFGLISLAVRRHRDPSGNEPDEVRNDSGGIQTSDETREVP